MWCGFVVYRCHEGACGPHGCVRVGCACGCGIHTVVICGCGFPHWEGNFDSLKLMCKTCFGNPEMICVPETPLLNVPAAVVVTDPLLKRFEEAGEEYAASLRLSPKTVAELERPMISAEDYIRNVNGG